MTDDDDAEAAERVERLGGGVDFALDDDEARPLSATGATSREDERVALILLFELAAAVAVDLARQRLDVLGRGEVSPSFSSSKSELLGSPSSEELPLCPAEPEWREPDADARRPDDRKWRAAVGITCPGDSVRLRLSDALDVVAAAAAAAVVLGVVACGAVAYDDAPDDAGAFISVEVDDERPDDAPGPEEADEAAVAAAAVRLKKGDMVA